MLRRASGQTLRSAALTTCRKINSHKKSNKAGKPTAAREFNSDRQLELQQQYTNYKNNLQQLAQRIGDIEQDAEEHRYVDRFGLECEPRRQGASSVAPSYESDSRSPADRLLNRLVLETLGPLPPERKCFRMINGVLVERTVKDVTPALQTNSDGLKKVLEELVKQYKKQQDDMEKWKVGCKLLSLRS